MSDQGDAHSGRVDDQLVRTTEEVWEALGGAAEGD